MNKSPYHKVIEQAAKKAEIMILKLQEHLKEEYSENIGDFTVYTTLWNRNELDFLPEGYQLVKETDRKRELVNLQIVQEASNKKLSVVVDELLLENDKDDIIRKEAVLHGRIVTDDNEYIVPLTIVPNTDYIEEAKKLYPIAIANHTSIGNLNVPYFYHFYRILLAKDTLNLKNHEQIKRIEIFYDELGIAYHHDLVPVWNLRKNIATTKGKRVLSNNELYYQHNFPKGNNISGRLIVLPEDFQGRIIHNEKETTVYQIHEVIEKWEVIEFCRPIKEELSYMCFSNLLKDTFSNGLSFRYGRKIPCRAEAERIARAYEDSEYLTYLYCEISDKPEPYTTHLIEGLQSRFISYTSASPCLVFYFKNRGICGCYANDIMHFLVAEIQECFTGYHVIGKLIEGEI